MKKFSLSLLFAIMMLGLFATAASATPTQDPANNDGEDHNEIMPIETADPNENANDTGSGVDTNDGTTRNDVIKSDGMKNKDGSVTTHKTHGEYQNNTNSCASCHQTHTSKAKQLLFADSTYQTCSACHDGTLGFYNVFETGANASLDGAGTFGGSHANNMSIHQSNDSVLIKAAPGGNQGTGDDAGKGWNATFSCASCHAPHGSYSDRLLHYNPNGMATRTTEGGKQLTGLVPSITSPAANTYGLVMFDSGEALTDDPAIAKKIVLSYGNTAQKTPWLYGYGAYGTPHYTHLAYDHPVHGTGRIQYGNTDVYFNNEQGYWKALTKKGQEILTGSTTLTGQVSLAYVVQMDLREVANIDGLKIFKNNQSAYWTGKDVFGVTQNELKDSGIAMSNYCSACHTDYLANTKTGKNQGANGTFSNAYRHTTESNSYTCVRCHFAHGTDAELMMNAEGKTVADLVAGGMNQADALAYMNDTNPSSALKKFTNMTVCWACHNSSKATTIKNTVRPDDHPTGMPTTDVDFGVDGVITISR